MEENKVFIKSFEELAVLGYVEKVVGENSIDYNFTAKASKYKNLFVKHLKEYNLMKSGKYGIREPDLCNSFVSPIFFADENGMGLISYTDEELLEVEKKVLEEMKKQNDTTA